MESHQQTFRSNKVPSGETPLETLTRLKDAAYQWLRPEENTKEQIVDMIILEQFLAVLPTDLQAWLRDQKPKSSTEAASLAENFQGKKKPTDVVMVSEILKDLSVTMTTDNEPEPEQRAFYFEVAEETDEIPLLAGNQPNNWFAKSWTPHSQGQTDQQLIFTPYREKKGLDDVIQIEKVCEEDLQKETSQIYPMQFKHEKDDQSWFLPLVRIGNNLQKKNLDNVLEEYLRSQVNINAGKGRHYHEYESYTDSDSYTSCSDGDTEMSHSETSSHKDSESETSFNLGLDFINPSSILQELKPPSDPIVGKDLSNSQTNCSQTSDSSSSASSRHTCETCEKSFAWKSSLSRHRKIHTGEKPHSCPDCDKSFYVRSALVAHQRTHTGEKPFQCETCGRRFYIRSSLVAHRRIHTEEKPFRCGTCGKCFKLKSYLASHELIHRDKQFHCPLCEKKFRRRAQLQSHCKTHTSEMCHQCYVCGTCFTDHASLVRHEKRHFMQESTRKVPPQVYSA